MRTGTREAELSRTAPTAARVVKTTAFSLEEWAAIETLFTVLKVQEFTKLCRVGLRELADRNNVKWPEDRTS